MSNGSEHMPERCVHAPDGPDWAGLRELYPAEVDPWEGFTGQSEADAADAAITDPLLKRIHELEAENEKLRKAKDHVTSNYLLVSQRKRDAEAKNERLVGLLKWAQDEGIRYLDERDALQARLDAMTVEVRASTIGVDERGRVKVGQAPRFRQRLVGPWTVVPEGDTNA